MRIRLAILHNDTVYLNRLISALEGRYRDQLVIYSFTNSDAVLDTLFKEKIDVFLADETISFDTKNLPPKCGFAYLVDSPEVDSINGHPAVCRFQRTELIYKQVLGIFSEILGEASVRNLYSDSTKVLIFSSPCGGTGTSTLAAACAAHFALGGKRCLYLNLEDFGGADSYFSGDGTADMSDVIYAVKRRLGSLPIKLESCVKRDYHGVCYFATARLAVDMLELSSSERLELISALMESGSYDVIVVDMAFDLKKETRDIFEKAHVLAWVGDGRPASNLKLSRAYETLQILDQGAQTPLTDRIMLIWNKMAGEQIADLPDIGHRCIGSVTKLKHQINEQIIYQLADSEVFNAILCV